MVFIDRIVSWYRILFGPRPQFKANGFDLSPFMCYECKFQAVKVWTLPNDDGTTSVIGVCEHNQLTVQSS